MRDKIIENIKNRILAEKRKHGTTQHDPDEWAKIAAAKIVSEHNIVLLHTEVCECTDTKIIKSENGTYWCWSCGKFPVITA